MLLPEFYGALLCPYDILCNNLAVMMFVIQHMIALSRPYTTLPACLQYHTTERMPSKVARNPVTCWKLFEDANAILAQTVGNKMPSGVPWEQQLLHSQTTVPCKAFPADAQSAEPFFPQICEV